MASIAFFAFTTQTESGARVSVLWLNRSTREFARRIEQDGAELNVTDEGKDLLNDHKMWLQILDANGSEILSHAKPDTIPSNYSPRELLDIDRNGLGKYSVFVNGIEKNGKQYICLIGVPASLMKLNIGVDENMSRMGVLATGVILIVTFVSTIAMTLYYNRVIVRNLDQISTSIRSVSSGDYRSFNDRTTFRDIYKTIDLLNEDIQRRQSESALDEKARKEWYANITHDLKTPLAAIRGYAEILAYTSDIDPTTAKRYGETILRNGLYAAQLIDDLKLVYQLQSNMMPLKTESLNIALFVRDIVIDVLNTQEYEGRSITFSSDRTNQMITIDTTLTRRALTNIIVNAVKHNKSDTEVVVKIDCDNGIVISVADNGVGMSEQELNGLFKRYYRGSSSADKPEGSGLGMAIAKQIVEAQGASIYAQSEIGVGTTVYIVFPNNV